MKRNITTRVFHCLRSYAYPSNDSNWRSAVRYYDFKKYSLDDALLSFAEEFYPGFEYMFGPVGNPSNSYSISLVNIRHSTCLVEHTLV